MQKMNLKWIILSVSLLIIVVGGSIFYITQKRLSTADRSKLIVMLNSAVADEWFSHYQYFLASKVVKGDMQKEASDMFAKFSLDELENVSRIADKVISFAGILPMEPKIWYEIAKCGFAVPSDPSTKKLIEQNIESEKGFIDHYKQILSFVGSKDEETNKIVNIAIEYKTSHLAQLQTFLEQLK